MATESEFPPLKVLVVDANVRHCLLYRMEMEALGYEVVCAHNGHEALHQLQHRRFNVAVIDITLPDINSSQLLQKISTTRSHFNENRLPVIINTAYPYPKRQRQKWTVDAFILKSSNLDELIGKVTLFAKP